MQSKVCRFFLMVLVHGFYISDLAGESLLSNNSSNLNQPFSSDTRILTASFRSHRFQISLLSTYFLEEMINFPSNLQKKPWYVCPISLPATVIESMSGKVAHICRRQPAEFHINPACQKKNDLNRLLNLKSGKSIIQPLGCRCFSMDTNHQGGGKEQKDGDF